MPGRFALLQEGKRALASLAALLVSAGVLLAGNGLFGTLIAVRANLENFPPTTIGLLGSAFYAGFIAGSMRCTIAPLIAVEPPTQTPWSNPITERPSAVTRWTKGGR